MPPNDPKSCATNQEVPLKEEVIIRKKYLVQDMERFTHVYSPQIVTILICDVGTKIKFTSYRSLRHLQEVIPLSVDRKLNQIVSSFGLKSIRCVFFKQKLDTKTVPATSVFLPCHFSFKSGWYCAIWFCRMTDIGVAVLS